MSLSSVTILCPNARRVPIKVTPSTLLRKVLEEACLSNGFDPVSHELRHHKKPLDLALPLRLSGLPNNATLDLVESIVSSAVQDVTIALQLPTARHEVKCKASDSLLEVVRLVSEAMGVDLVSANEEGHPSCSYMNRQYRGELELSFRTLGSIGISGGRILIRYMRLPLDIEKLEEIERSINEERTEKERLEKKFETAKKENEARLRREEEEEKQIERLREEEERRVREEEERITINPPIQMIIPDRLPSGPSMATSDGGWAFDSPFVAPPPTVPSSATVTQSPAPIRYVSPVRSARIEALEALLQNVNQDLNSGSGSSAIVDTVAEVGRIPVRSVNDILSAGRMETEKISEPLTERCERRAVFFKREDQSERSEEELGDEFFELTVDDLKNIQRGHREVVRGQTQRALLPRSTLEERNKERKLSAWKHVVIRFKLANEVIIQGCFLPHEPASHLHEFLSSIIDGSFVLRFVTSKIANEEKKSLLALDLAPKATIVVSCGEVSINEEMAKQVSAEEAEENSRDWLSANSSYVPYAPTVDPEPTNLAQKRAADLSPTSQRRSIPESLPTGPKWLKKK
ncbi:asps-1 [Pristionchus pacificus]|uniref:TUG-UBL1 domain-containing protein n=1 Tax=Pristionchus pacificus TaxID=54126 RepID=A0A2A6CA45_PRIPA|nr:asps-1 [Pristionchus pacificus]|eukprot:PDM75054.1 hypothetical protein PRIPAC_40435 [Pristionchus pacificus]